MIRSFLPRRSLLAAAAGLALAATLAVPMGAAAEEAWPARPITIVVPYPPGGSNDVFARAVGKKLSTARWASR